LIRNDGLNLVICNILFMKQESKLVTYVARSVKSTVYHITVCTECVPKHKLLVLDMQFKTTKRWHKKLEPRVCLWKLKEEKTHKE